MRTTSAVLIRPPVSAGGTDPPPKRGGAREAAGESCRKPNRPGEHPGRRSGSTYLRPVIISAIMVSSMTTSTPDRLLDAASACSPQAGSRQRASVHRGGGRFPAPRRHGLQGHSARSVDLFYAVTTGMRECKKRPAISQACFRGDLARRAHTRRAVPARGAGRRRAGHRILESASATQTSLASGCTGMLEPGYQRMGDLLQRWVG